MTNSNEQKNAYIKEQLKLNEYFMKEQKKRLPTLKNDGVIDIQMLNEYNKMIIRNLFSDSGLMSKMEAEAQIKIAEVRMVSNLLDYLKEGTTKGKDSEDEKPIN